MDITSFPVDVVEMEKIPADVAERIRKRAGWYVNEETRDLILLVSTVTCCKK